MFTLHYAIRPIAPNNDSADFVRSVTALVVILEYGKVPRDVITTSLCRNLKVTAKGAWLSIAGRCWMCERVLVGEGSEREEKRDAYTHTHRYTDTHTHTHKAEGTQLQLWITVWRV